MLSSGLAASQRFIALPSGFHPHGADVVTTAAALVEPSGVAQQETHVNVSTSLPRALEHDLAAQSAASGHENFGALPPPTALRRLAPLSDALRNADDNTARLLASADIINTQFPGVSVIDARALPPPVISAVISNRRRHVSMSDLNKQAHVSGIGLFNYSQEHANVIADVQRHNFAAQKRLSSSGIIHTISERRLSTVNINSSEERELIAIALLRSLTIMPSLQEEQEPGNSVLLAHLASAFSSASYIARNREEIGDSDEFLTRTSCNPPAASLPFWYPGKRVGHDELSVRDISSMSVMCELSNDKVVVREEIQLTNNLEYSEVNVSIPSRGVSSEKKF